MDMALLVISHYTKLGNLNIGLDFHGILSHGMAMKLAFCVIYIWNITMFQISQNNSLQQMF